MAFTERRVVYGRAGTPTPWWMWAFQRFSGIVLGPLVFVHVLVPRAPFITWVSALLLVVILGHAFIGLWRLAAMRRFSNRVASLGVTASLLYILVVGFFGVALLISIRSS
jgi:succinate dehydrogenase hydrophobic anchor subunit